MNSRRSLAPLTGAAAVVAVVAGLALDAAPTSSWSDARIHAWYATHGNGRWLLSAYLIALGAPLLLTFTAVVRERLALAGAGDRARSLVLGAGVAWAVTLLTGAGLYAAVPAARVFSKAPAPGADISRYLLGASYGVLVMFSALAAALLAATISVTSVRVGGVLPRWLAIAGIPASLLMLANAAMPMAVVTLWYLAASIALAVPRSPAPARSAVRLPEPARSAV